MLPPSPLARATRLLPPPLVYFQTRRIHGWGALCSAKRLVQERRQGSAVLTARELAKTAAKTPKAYHREKAGRVGTISDSACRVTYVSSKQAQAAWPGGGVQSDGWGPRCLIVIRLPGGGGWGFEKEGAIWPKSEGGERG